MTEKLEIVRTVEALRERVRPWRAAGQRVGLVPTMGALHAGHMALVGAALGANDRVVATLFVNPAQFGPNEDLDRYPRREAEDARTLDEAGVDLLFAPPVEEMYPEGFATRVNVDRVTERMEGAARPGHFEGVATVVSKLLIQSEADRAYFGEKDYQQLIVIRHLARDLNIPVEIVGVPTVREKDGLALSSRNEYLTPAQREVAGNLNRVLFAAADALSGGAPVAEQVEQGIAALEQAGFEKVDYLEVCDPDTLEPLDRVEGRARVLGAARIGGVRLIDNVPAG